MAAGLVVVLAVYVALGGVMFWYLEEIDEHREDETSGPSAAELELISKLLQQLNKTGVRGTDCSPHQNSH